MPLGGSVASRSAVDAVHELGSRGGVERRKPNECSEGAQFADFKQDRIAAPLGEVVTVAADEDVDDAAAGSEPWLVMDRHQVNFTRADADAVPVAEEDVLIATGVGIPQEVSRHHVRVDQPVAEAGLEVCEGSAQLGDSPCQPGVPVPTKNAGGARGAEDSVQLLKRLVRG